MDGKGYWRDNVFVERLWKSVKYEEVYLHAYDSVSDAKQGLEKYFQFYNQNRPYTALDDKTPDELYFDKLPVMQKAVQALTARLPFKKWEILSKLAEPPLSLGIIPMRYLKLLVYYRNTKTIPKMILLELSNEAFPISQKIRNILSVDFRNSFGRL